MAVTIPLPDAEQSQRIAINRASKATTSTQAFRQNKNFLLILCEVNPAIAGNYDALMAYVQAHADVYSADDQIDGVTPAQVEDGYLTNLVTQMHIREDQVPVPEP